MNPNLELYAALVVVWAIALALTYRWCVHDTLRSFLRSIRGNRRVHRKALYLSVNHSIRRMK